MEQRIAAARAPARARAAEAALLGVALVWGASYPVAKGALAVVPALALVALRFTVAAAVTGAPALPHLRAARRADLGRAAALGVVLFGIFAAETFGVALTTATAAAFLISLSTALTSLLDYGLSGRTPPATVAGGVLLCCFGAAILGGGLSGFGAGDALMLLAAALRAALVVATRRLTAARPLPPVALTAVQSAVVALLAGATALLVPGAAALHGEPDLRFWAAVAFLSLFCTVGALLVQNVALRRTSPTRVAFLLGTEPAFGFAFAILLLGEPPTARAFLGGSLILAGTALGLFRAGPRGGSGSRAR